MRRRGFTLIEVVTVCAILSMLAALVYPNVVAMKSSRERDAAYANVLRLAQAGREAAIQGGKTYSLSLSEGGTTVLLQQDEETTGIQDARTTNQEDAVPTQFRLPTGIVVGGEADDKKGGGGAGAGGGVDEGSASARLPEGVTVGESSLDGKASGTSDFVLHFYPDGRSEGGGFEMIDRSTTRVLFVERNGIATLKEGTLPAASEPSWEAGQYEQRASS